MWKVEKLGFAEQINQIESVKLKMELPIATTNTDKKNKNTVS